MKVDGRVRVVPMPSAHAGPRRRFGPDDCYPAAVWLPVLGPASFLLWRHLARQLCRGSDGVTITLASLAVDLGLGSPHGRQAAVVRAIRRLERFGLLRRVTDELFLVCDRLPSLSPRQLERLHPSVQARHHHLHARADRR